MGWVLATCLAFMGPTAASLTAQVTSPGELSWAHEDWSRPGECAQCHQVGSRRTSDQRCLSCHVPLSRRIEAGQGFHATRSTDCASCHRDHRGAEANLVRFEPAGFEHATIGYALEGRHADLDCDGCHNTLGVRDREVRLFKGRYGALTRTHLGLSQSCAACHERRDPHAGQFEGRECATCHDETLWAPATGFDHARARYPLTGRHRDVACTDCHRETTPVRYRPLTFEQCSSCHRDTHVGEMKGRCATCHSTSGWDRIPRGRFEGDFDHASTGFALDGRHADADCTSCHRARPAGDPGIALTFVDRSLPSYPRPAFEACGSCHLDFHAGAFERSPLGPDCAACHTGEGWAPSEFDVFKHDSAAFALTGAHRVVPCLDCHGAEDTSTSDAPALASPFHIHLGPQTCASCHAGDDPHAGQFEGAACESCHSTSSFAVERFDHSITRFPLDGAHEGVPCAGCHLPEPGASASGATRYRALDTACRSCHGESSESGAAPRRQSKGASP